GGERDTEVTRQFDDGAWQHENIFGRQYLRERHVVCKRRSGQQVPGTLGDVHLISLLAQGMDHEVAPALELGHIDAQRLKVGHGVLKHCIWKAISTALCSQDSGPHMFPLQHRRRKGQVAKPLPRRQQRLCITVDQERIWVMCYGTREVSPIEEYPVVRLIGHDVDGLAVLLRRCAKRPGQSVQSRARINLSRRVVRRVYDDCSGPWRDGRSNRINVKVEGSQVDLDPYG